VIEDIDEEIDLDELEEKLQNRLDEEVSELKFLVEEKKKIGSVDNLGEIIKETVWEQFLKFRWFLLLLLPGWDITVLHIQSMSCC